MILRDASIMAAMTRQVDPLIVDPPVPDKALQPASLELTLAGDYLIDGGSAMNAAGKIVHGGLHARQKDPGHAIDVYPKDFILATTLERVVIPADMVAQVNGKSSWARRGLVVHQTAGFIDPGFRGQITLELSNASRQPIRLWVGQPICQLVFM